MSVIALRRDLSIPDEVPDILPPQILFANSLDVVLYGILLFQAGIYYLAFPHDKAILKAVVSSVVIIGTLQTIFALHDFHALFCTTEGNDYLSGSLDPHNFGFMWLTIPTSTATVAFIFQSMYAYRIWTILKRKVFPIIITTLSFSQLVTGIYVAAVVYRPGVRRIIARPDIETSTATNALVWGLLGTTCDVLIAGYMIIFLWKQLRGIPRKAQDHITRIHRFLLETGLLIALLGIAYVVTSAMEWPNWFTIPGLTLSKLYANSMLVMLNNRLVTLDGRNLGDPSFNIPSLSGPIPLTHPGPRALSHLVFAANSPTVTTCQWGGDIKINVGADTDTRVSGETSEDRK